MFREKLLGDVLTFQRGFDITKQQQTTGDVPIVSSSGVSSHHGVAKVVAPGVVIGRKGTLGTVHYLAKDFWPHDTTLWVKDFKGNHPRFIYYFLQTLHLENFDTGSSNPTLNRNHIHKIKIFFPDRGEQEKIVVILSVYDDLIINNQRRITLLESMAEEIYREWFVRMRFPGYSSWTFIKGRPDSWAEGRLEEIATFTMGQSPSSEFYNSNGDGLPFHQGVGTYGPRYPKHEVFCSQSGRRAKAGDILFSVRAPVGRLNIADVDLTIGRGLAALRHKQGKNSYLFYLLRVSFANEDIIGNGSIFNSVGKDELANFPIYKPDMSLVERFEKIVQPIDAEIYSLYSIIKQLQDCRNSLLPRLISGKLKVDHLDIQFPPSMREDAAA